MMGRATFDKNEKKEMVLETTCLCLKSLSLIQDMKIGRMNKWKPWRKQRRQKWYEDDETSSGKDYPWDKLQTQNLEVLPDEILGWLLLRRPNLSAASRLSVQASVNNSPKFGGGGRRERSGRGAVAG